MCIVACQFRLAAGTFLKSSNDFALFAAKICLVRPLPAECDDVINIERTSAWMEGSLLPTRANADRMLSLSEKYGKGRAHRVSHQGPRTDLLMGRTVVQDSESSCRRLRSKVSKSRCTGL